MAQSGAAVLVVPGPVIRALLEGEQVIDVRGANGTSPPPRVWLCPGGEADVKPAYSRARELSQPDEAPGPGRVWIEGWADIVGAATLRLDPDRAAALESKTVLALDRLAERLAGGDVAVLALRVHRLTEPVEAAADLSDVSALPPDPAALPAEPALSDVAFEAKVNGVADALPAGFSPVP